MVFRRRNDGAWPVVAAEVLEVRSLLSAGAVAAHAAQHHAADLGHVADPLATQKGTVTAGISIGPETFTDVRGTLSISAAKIVGGSKVTVKLSFAFPVGSAETVSLKGSFQGKISAVVTQAGQTDVTVIPTGGSMAFTLSMTGHQPITVKAAPGTTPFMVGLSSGGGFRAFEGADVFPANAPVVDLANQPLGILAVA